MPTYDFSGEVAFVTGGSAGTGTVTVTVRAFAEAGAAVAIVDLEGQETTVELAE